MIWIFALGIIGFCLVHKGFRKVVLWLVGGLAALAACYMFSLSDFNPAHREREAQAKAQAEAVHEVENRQTRIATANNPECQHFKLNSPHDPNSHADPFGEALDAVACGYDLPH